MIVLNYKYYLKSIVTACAVTMFFSCQNDLKNIQNLQKSSFAQSGEADSIHLIYTDSGKTKAILVSPKMLDYGTLENPYTEFPKGILVTIYDEKQNKTFVKADFATSYKRTKIIDLKGNVKITSHDGKLFETVQLYYDQENEWFFTEKPFKYTDEKGGFLQGPGVDFSKDFKVFNMQKSNGEVTNLD